MNNIATASDAEFEELFETPDMFLWQFDGTEGLFVRMDRNAYHDSIFLDQRILATSRDIVRIDCARLHDLFSKRPPKNSRLRYIFHVAHCGSTLLARALDIRVGNIVYREPAALRQLGAQAAAAFHGATPPAEWQQKLDLSVALLNRSYTNDGPIVVKANVPVNFMIPALLDASNDSAVLLYSSLENYLLAVLKSPTHRAWVAAITTELGPAIEAVTGITAEQRRALSIPEAASCLWMAQIMIFDQTLKSQAGSRSLDAETFYDDPENTLQKYFEFIGQAIDAASIGEIVKGELFTRYSKDPRQSYSNETRIAQRKEMRGQLAADIEKGRGWVNRHIGKCGIPEVLASPLAGSSPPLLD
jgi:hypothetical protein